MQSNVPSLEDMVSGEVTGTKSDDGEDPDVARAPAVYTHYMHVC